MAVDFTDPCARADALRDAYYGILLGSQQTEVEYLANNVTRRVRFAASDLDVLSTELRAAEQECAGMTARRVSTIRLVTLKGV